MFIADSDLVERCFWHGSENQLDNRRKKASFPKVVNQTGAAAIFYLMTCLELIKVEEDGVDQILKGSTMNWFKMKRKALVSAFGVSECNFVLAIRKIKASPDLVRMRTGTPAVSNQSVDHM